MTTASWVNLASNLLLTAGLVWWVIAAFRRDKHMSKEMETREQVLEMLELGIERLKQASLAVLYLKHARYRSDDEEPPITVKCIDCGDVCGSVDKVEDILTVAGEHVIAKFEEVARNAERIAADVKA